MSEVRSERHCALDEQWTSPSRLYVPEDEHTPLLGLLVIVGFWLVLAGAFIAWRFWL